jgi:hypothetical protein
MPGEEGTWEDLSVLMPSVLEIRDTLHMWYAGFSAAEESGIGHVFSTDDGLTWTKNPENPVLKTGPEGSWDELRVYVPSVVYDETNSIFHLWYVGADASGHEESGYASSTDGINWTKYASNPIHVKLGTSAILLKDNKFHLWGSSSSQNGWVMGYFRSDDGITWSEVEDPVMSPESGKWDYPRVQSSSAVFDGNTYHLWYSGGGFMTWQIGYATSTDGIAWIKHKSNPVLGIGESGSWDSQFVGFPSVIYDSDRELFRMWYWGGKEAYTGSIGYAESVPFINIPDTAFLSALLEEGLDLNGDSLISYTEAAGVLSLDVSEQNISDMIGIEEFSSLDTLLCHTNQLSTLNVYHSTGLSVLSCGYNLLENLNVFNNTGLSVLSCGYNLLKNLNVFNNTGLTDLRVPGNQLTSLDVSENTELSVLHCEENQLFSLDVSNNTGLSELHCQENQLISLNASNCTALVNLECRDNNLTILDVSDNTELVTLQCAENQLTTLDVSNNTALEYLDISSMPTLEKVCVWTTPFPPEGVEVDTSGSPNVYFEVCPTGNEKALQLPESVIIYPNPSTDFVTVESGDADHIRSIEIIDMYGRTVRTIDNINNNAVTIYSGKLLGGIYIFRIHSENSFIRKVVIK